LEAENKMKKYELHLGSNLEVLPKLADCSVDAIVTDPPYELGFMGKAWDASGIAYNVGLWRECLRVLKPGGHILAFSGSRTYHRMTCAIEDAGFEIRDQMMWVYGSGFPKSHNIKKALDKSEEGQETAKKWEGWGTALKPSHEPICLARKPIEGTIADNVLKWGTGGINIDACRVSADGEDFSNVKGQPHLTLKLTHHHENGNAEALDKLKRLGRFPANLLHDGSQDVVELFPGEEGSSAARFFYCPKASKSDRDEGCEAFETRKVHSNLNTKNGSGERLDGEPTAERRNFHPTVKPTELMKYLCRLITPPGGVVLDPFAGSGSTGKAALAEGFYFIGIELNQEYLDIANARIYAASNEA
jgi:site-specific DNA-methyltransferase (adenine-specific)